MSPETEIAELAQQLRETNELLRERLGGGSTASGKIGSGFGHGILIGVTIATCAATWIGLILFAMDIHDLRAWRDIHSNDIAKLQSRVTQLEGQRK